MSDIIVVAPVRVMEKVRLDQPYVWLVQLLIYLAPKSDRSVFGIVIPIFSLACHDFAKPCAVAHSFLKIRECSRGKNKMLNGAIKEIDR